MCKQPGRKSLTESDYVRLNGINNRRNHRRLLITKLGIS